MQANSFPVWPPSSPQRPAAIPGRGTLRQVEDLLVNQIPRGRGDEIPIVMKAVPRVVRPEPPGSPESLNSGKYGSTLYDLFNMTQQVVLERQLRSAAQRGG